MHAFSFVFVKFEKLDDLKIWIRITAILIIVIYELYYVFLMVLNKAH